MEKGFVCFFEVRRGKWDNVAEEEVKYLGRKKQSEEQAGRRRWFAGIIEEARP